MPGLKKEQEAYVKAFRAAAGDANVIFAGGHNFRYSERSMAQVDAIIGMCRESILKIASPNLRWIHNYSVGMDPCTGATPEQLANITFTNNKRLYRPADRRTQHCHAGWP